MRYPEPCVEEPDVDARRQLFERFQELSQDGRRRTGRTLRSISSAFTADLPIAARKDVRSLRGRRGVATECASEHPEEPRGAELAVHVRRAGRQRLNEAQPVVDQAICATQRGAMSFSVGTGTRSRGGVARSRVLIAQQSVAADNPAAAGGLRGLLRRLPLKTLGVHGSSR